MGAPCNTLFMRCLECLAGSKNYDKRDDFDFDIVNFPFLDGDVPRRASYAKLWCIHFATYLVCSSLQSCCGLQCSK